MRSLNSRKEGKAMQTEYRIILRPLESSEGIGWLAEVPDLPGCRSDGETPEKAAANVKDAITCWMETSLELGREIPESTHVSANYSGKFLIRIPKSLHRSLVESADKEGTSLNQYITYLLAERNALQVERGIKHDTEQGICPVSHLVIQAPVPPPLTPSL